MLSQAALTRQVRLHVARELYDDSGAPPEGTAIYSLADPRDLCVSRYVGQTAAPRRRFLQHLQTARLWLPDERPWWIRAPQLRPLYDWIRALHAEGRLPTMVVHEWVDTKAAALVAERTLILTCLARGLPLLNVETERLGAQLALL